MNKNNWEEIIQNYLGDVRISNKSGGYWWCYIDEFIGQGKTIADAVISAWEQKCPPVVLVAYSGLVPWPNDWKDYRHNACNDPCDMLVGPCACGGWHSKDEYWVKEKLSIHGAKIL